MGLRSSALRKGLKDFWKNFSLGQRLSYPLDRLCAKIEMKMDIESNEAKGCSGRGELSASLGVCHASGVLRPGTGRGPIPPGIRADFSQAREMPPSEKGESD